MCITGSAHADAERAGAQDEGDQGGRAKPGGRPHPRGPHLHHRRQGGLGRLSSGPAAQCSFKHGILLHAHHNGGGCARQVPEPEFEGQTKTRLGNPEVRKIVDACVARVRHRISHLLSTAKQLPAVQFELSLIWGCDWVGSR